MVVPAHSRDPFDIFTAPPPDETPAERSLREQREAEAARVSALIDEEISLHRAYLKKEKNMIRVLLVGQAESGKSTTLKNFRLKYSREAWDKERESWRAVIQLNLIRSIVTILQVLRTKVPNNVPSSASSTSDGDSDESVSSVHFTEKHQLLQLRLGPLHRVEVDLKRRLGAGAEEVLALSDGPMHATPFDTWKAESQSIEKRTIKEFAVRSWRDALRGPDTKANTGGSEATQVISGCKEDIQALWDDETVQHLLKKGDIQLADSAEFFLKNLERIASRSYEPSDDDIVRARLRTAGVQEYKITFEAGASHGETLGREWKIYDVGGCRTNRAAWLPYFEGLHALIFLCPVSTFDERLAEDPRVNRLEDSFILWKAIVSSKLLTRTTIILFLNKCDLLDAKLVRGIQVNKYLPSYGERTNNSATVVAYLRDKFKAMLKHHSPEPRISYSYPTSVTDTEATAMTLTSVRNGIFRDHLADAALV